MTKHLAVFTTRNATVRNDALNLFGNFNFAKTAVNRCIVVRGA